jgi:hypothetical protein
MANPCQAPLPEVIIVRIYDCRICKGCMVVKDRDAGVAPGYLRCRVTPDCLGIAVQREGMIDQSLAPEYLFIRPDADERQGVLDAIPEEARAGMRRYLDDDLRGMLLWKLSGGWAT